jgi:hypothetical protein
MQRIATGRIVGLLVAVIGIGLSVWCAREAVRMNAEFHRWSDARPMETVIDVSKPGETTVPFHQTCSIPHGEALFLYAKYQLCGLERMPATIAGAFAFGAGMIGLVAGVCAFPGLLRCGIWRNAATANA